MICGNIYVPGYKIIGVICPYQREFEQWLEQNHKDGEYYVILQETRDLRGRMFDRIEKSDRWYLAKVDIDLANKRIKKV